MSNEITKEEQRTRKAFTRMATKALQVRVEVRCLIGSRAASKLVTATSAWEKRELERLRREANRMIRKAIADSKPTQVPVQKPKQKEKVHDVQSAPAHEPEPVEHQSVHTRVDKLVTHHDEATIHHKPKPGRRRFKTMVLSAMMAMFGSR